MRTFVKPCWGCKRRRVNDSLDPHERASPQSGRAMCAAFAAQLCSTNSIARASCAARLGWKQPWSRLSRCAVSWHCHVARASYPFSRLSPSLQCPHAWVPLHLVQVCAHAGIDVCPQVRIGGRPVVCIFGTVASRVKSSHFRSSDAQLMLRECWHEITHLFIMDFQPGQHLYRSRVPRLSPQLPRFRWSSEFENWDALPQPWVVVNSDSIAAESRHGIQDLPLP